MQDKKYLSFDVEDKNVKIRNILNQDFLEITADLIADHCPNNNMSHFEFEAMKEAIPTFYNKPILGSFNQMVGEQDIDFGAHDSEYIEDSETGAGYFDNSGPGQEVPLGLITESSKVEIVTGDDGANWIRVQGYIWVKYATKAVLSLLRRHKGRCKVSVEVEVLDSEFDEETGIEHIKKFNMLGFTLLGSYPNHLLGTRMEIHEGIEGANLKVINFSKNPKFQAQLKQLTFACKQLEKSMNLNNSKSNQNENKTEKVDNSVPKEGSDIYHPVPKPVENEEVPEIGYSEDDDEGKEKDCNSDNTKTNTEKSTNSRKDEKSQMNFSLSYNSRRDLLDAALQECINNNYVGDRKYGWVMDFDDEIVYFYLEVDGNEGNWCAPYTLTLKSENNEDKVIDCVIDFNSKEKVVREWKKLNQNESSETEGKTDMKDNKNFTEEDKQTEAQNFADDRGTEAPKSGDARGVPASHTGGEDTQHPHTPATYEDSEENKDEAKKETEASDDSKDDSKEDKSKETEACEDKETEACNDKETEAKDVTEVKSTPAGGDKKVTHVPSKSVSSEDDSDDSEKCDCSKDDSKEEWAKDDSKEECSKEECAKDGDKEEECNYEAKFAQLSQDYVAMQKENETLKAVNAKFEADIADLMSKVSKFEAEKNEAVNTNLYNFGLNMINAETDLSEDTRKTMSAELETECKASKFSSEDDVKKFTVTKIAMALYEARQAKKETMSQKESKKEEFVQTIIPGTSVSKNESVDELTAKRNALEAI